MNTRVYIISIGLILMGFTVLLVGACHSENETCAVFRVFTPFFLHLYLLLNTLLNNHKVYLMVNIFVPVLVIGYLCLRKYGEKTSLKNMETLLAIIILCAGAGYYAYEALLSPTIPPDSRSRDFAMYYLGAYGINQSRNFYFDWAYYIRDKRSDHPFIQVDGPDPEPGYLDRILAEHGIGRIPPYTYPPIWYICCLPLLAFSWQGAFDVFLLFNQILIIISLLFLQHGRAPVMHARDAILLSGLLFYYYPFVKTVSGGQVNILILTLISAALLLLRYRKDISAGALLAVATAIKMHPVLLIGYCFLKRRYTAVVAAIICLAILMLVSTAMVGMDIMEVYYLSVLPKWASNMRAHDMNVSVAGLISRLFIGYRWLKAPFDNPALAKLLVTCSTVCVLGFLAVLYAIRATRASDLFEMEFSIVIIATALVSTWTLDHHLVLLLIPYAVFLHSFTQNRKGIIKYIFLLVSYSLISWRYHYWEPYYREGWPTLFLSIRTLGIAIVFFVALHEYFTISRSKP